MLKARNEEQYGFMNVNSIRIGIFIMRLMDE